jgi:hypothetical protein
MRFLKYICAAVIAYVMVSATPALAQFEVSPDHFDGPQTVNKNMASPKKTQNQTNLEIKAGAKRILAAQVSTSTQKPSPCIRPVSTVSVARHRTHPSRSQTAWNSSAAAGHSLKAQAFPLPRE